jgi:hypothetical protein
MAWWVGVDELGSRVIRRSGVMRSVGKTSVFNTDTCDYIELCHFPQIIIGVDVSQSMLCPMSVFLCLCFIAPYSHIFIPELSYYLQLSDS